METRQCNKCKEVKLKSDFFKTGFHPSGKQKYRGDCKSCSSKNTSEWRKKNRSEYNSYMADYRTKNPDKFRAIDIKRNYGISIYEYKTMLQEQGNVCKICGKSPSGKRPLAIDHCHVSGKVRGILCYRCNLAISILDNKPLLAKALLYLK